MTSSFRFIPTKGLAKLAIGVCDGCHLRYPWVDLNPNPDIPGEMVCKECEDELDPWKLPLPQQEDISIMNARPDVDLTISPVGIVADESETAFIVTDDGEWIVP